MAKKKDQEEVIVDVKEVYTKTELFVDRNRKLLTTVLAVVVGVVALGAAYYYLVLKPQEQNAAEDSWKAEQYFEIDSTDLAMLGDGLYPGLEDIANEHSGTKVAARSHYQLGIIARDRGNFDEAISHFEKADINDEVISVLALGNIGDCQVELGEYEKAAKSFTKAASSAKGTNAEPMTAPLMHYKAGIAYMELDAVDDAIKHFETIVEDYPEAQVHGDAQRYAAYLGRK